MGCDIHCYIEYKKADHWNSFGGRINPGRDYAVFEAMAGVRGKLGNAVVAPRGLPEDISYSARDDSCLWITDSGLAEGCTTMENALHYVKHGSKFITGPNGTPTRVTHPDWHSHSWLTVKELEKAYEKLPFNPEEYLAILAAMKQFEVLGYESRLVFWFDN